MINWFFHHRFFIARRLTQTLILFAYFGANYFGWNTIIGNLSTALVFGVIPLSDPFSTLQMFFAGAVLTADILMGVAVVVFFYSVVGGRFFCSWVCPVNIVTETATWLRNILPFSTVDVCSTLPRSTRTWMIIISFALSYIFSLAAYEMINPIGIAHRGIIFGFGMGWVLLLAIFLFDLFSQEYAWCGHICPVGKFNALIGKYSLIKVVHDKDKCVNSLECFKACPEVQILNMVGHKSATITGSSCLKCARCIEVCETGAFEFSVVGIAKQLRDDK